MPCIHVHLLPSASLSQKRELVAEFTQSLVRILGKSPEHIHVILNEVSPANWGFRGTLTSDPQPQTPSFTSPVQPITPAAPQIHAPSCLSKPVKS